MNTVNSFTTPLLERHLAIKQIVHYLYVQQSAVNTGDKQERRRATDIIDRLTTEHGVESLRQAQDEYNE
ncbi:hypothetical protein EI534_07355 [Pseudomonas frederiksbergensis]|nr:hypothetical protein [Pseudomonas frederiksbergensis]